MKNYIYTIVHDTPISTTPNGEEGTYIVTSTNYEYYTSLEDGVKGLNETIDTLKRIVKDRGYTVVSESRENVGSPSEFYCIKLKEFEYSLGAYLTRLTLKEYN